MFKFLRKLKKKKGRVIEQAADGYPDITAQQLVQRFHSESALCDPSHRSMLIAAAEETHAQIQIRETAVDVKQRATAQCQQLSELQASCTDLRASHDDMRDRAARMQTHIIVHNAPIPALEERTSDYEQKIDNLVQMADMVQQATDELESNMRKSSQKRAKTRSKSRMRESFESRALFGSGLDHETSASCMEFGRRRVSVDGNTSLVDLVKETHGHLDEIPRRWDNIDTEALHKELAEVKVLMEQYDESTRQRELRLSQPEFLQWGRLPVHSAVVAM